MRAARTARTAAGMMPMTLRDKTAVVGIGATPYYRRGESLPQTELELACKAILAALDDAGLTVRDLDGFTIYSSSCDPAQVASVLGVPEVRFAATLTSGGGGAAGSLGPAAAAARTALAGCRTTPPSSAARDLSRPVTASRCLPGGTWNCTGRSASTWLRWRSPSARTPSDGRPRCGATRSPWMSTSTRG